MLKKYLLLLPLLLINSAAQAWVIEQGNFDQWVKGIDINPGVSAQLGLYFTNAGAEANKLNTQYKRQFPGQIMNRSFHEMRLAMTNLTDPRVACAPMNKVDFPESITENSTADIENFEKQIMRVESKDCLGVHDLTSVVNVFLSDRFQKESVKEIKTHQANQATNKVCQTSYAFGIGNSAFCFTYNMWRNEDTVVVHSLVDTNVANIQTPVYLRSLLIVFKKLSNGQILLYSLTYGRGPEIPLHSVVKSFVGQKHQTIINTLIDAL